MTTRDIVWDLSPLHFVSGIRDDMVAFDPPPCPRSACHLEPPAQRSEAGGERPPASYGEARFNVHSAAKQGVRDPRQVMVNGHHRLTSVLGHYYPIGRSGMIAELFNNRETAVCPCSYSDRSIAFDKSFL